MNSYAQSAPRIGLIPMSFPANEYLTITEAAELLRVSVPTIRRWIRNGTIRAHRVGQRRVLLNRNEVMDSVRPLDTRIESADNGFGDFARSTNSISSETESDPDDFDLGDAPSLTEHSPDRPVQRRLTPDEVERRLRSLEQAKALAAQLHTRQEALGILTPESWEKIREGREFRTEQLMGEDDSEFDQFDIGELANMIVHSPDRPRRRRLTPDEQQRWFAALDRAQRTSDRIQQRTGIDTFPPSEDIIAEMREERMRQLTGDDDEPEGRAE